MPASFRYAADMPRYPSTIPSRGEYAANMPGYHSTIPSHGEYAVNMPEYPCTIPPHVAEYTAKIPAYFLMPRIYREILSEYYLVNKYRKYE